MHLIPENIPFSDAIMIEPLSIAFQARSRANVVDDDIIFILGAGALGKSMIKAMALTKAKIIVADIFDDKLEEAKKLGAHYTVNAKKENMIEVVRKLSGGYGPTVSIDAAGLVSSLADLAELTCNAGRVITMAFLEEPSQVAIFKITAKELDIRGSRLQNNKFDEVINAVKNGDIDISGLVSHKIPFADTKKAFDLIDSKDASVKKIALIFD